MTFSFRNLVTQTWTIFKERPYYYLTLGLIFFLLSLAIPNTDIVFPRDIIRSIIAIIAIIIVAYTGISIALSSADHATDRLTFATLATHLPSVKRFFLFLLLGILSGVIIGLGLVALILPGIFLIVRLYFISFSFIDTSRSIRASFRHSWNITKGKWWRIFGYVLILIVCSILSGLLYGLATIILYPLSIIFSALVFRTLEGRKEEKVEPVEVHEEIEEEIVPTPAIESQQ